MPQPSISGTLNSVQLKAYGTTPSVDDVYHYTDEFAGLLARDPTRGTLADTNGGTDWIDAAAMTGNLAIDLNAGAGSTSNGSALFTIAPGTTIENVITGDGDDVLTGNDAANVLMGMRGNDRLDGGGGADTMRGGAGNDIYIVDNPGDVVDEGVAGSGGTDKVRSSISFSLADGAHAKGTIENLTLTGNAAIDGTGTDLANIIFGNGADNTLDGGAGDDKLNGRGGADTMLGGAGNDLYIVNNAGDVADEGAAGSGGIDTVRSSVTFSLADGVHARGTIENLTLTGKAAIGATGNAVANILVGNSGSNNIDGREGNDDLYGGAGADNFIFDTKIYKSATNRDVVHDFNVARDTIVLDNAIFPKLGGEGTINSKYFYEGTKAHDHNDYLIFNDKNDELIYDSNGSRHGHAKVIAIIDGTWDHSFSSRDFLIV